VQSLETFLTTTGIICIIAAIVGGGLKAQGIEFPVLSSRSRQLLLAGLGAVLVFAVYANKVNEEKRIKDELMFKKAWNLEVCNAEAAAAARNGAEISSTQCFLKEKELEP
jgi:hypothetical protein